MSQQPRLSRPHLHLDAALIAHLHQPLAPGLELVGGEPDGRVGIEPEGHGIVGPPFIATYLEFIWSEADAPVMAWRWPVAVALIVVTAGMAGCIGGNDASGPNDTPGDELAGTTADQGASTEALSGANLTTLSYPVEPGLNTTVWANGTFSVQNNCLAGGCVTGSAFEEIELRDPIPSDALVDVTATLSWDDGRPFLADGLNLYMYTEEGTFYAFNYTSEFGHEVIEATFLEDGAPLVVGVSYTGLPSAKAETAYTLEIDISVDPTIVPPGVPVELQAEPGQGFVFEAVGQSQGIEVLTYAPDDGFGGRLSSDGDRRETSVPPTLDAGKHVLVPTHDSAPIRILTNGTTAEMRPLHLDWQAGELHPVENNEPVNWTFEPDRVPVALGLYLTDDGPVAVSGLPGEATLEGPNGLLIDVTIGCTICLTFGVLGGNLQISTWTEIGADGLGPGTYEAGYQPTAEHGYGIGHVLIHYER